MKQDTLALLARGATAGVIGSVVQAMIGKSEEKLFLPAHENSDIAPRLMARLAALLGGSLSVAERWSLGTAFHLGYGAWWGVVYATMRERYGVPPVVAGTLLGSVIYGITFPRRGGAVFADVERAPGVRSPQMTLVAFSVTFGFGYATAFAYERLKDMSR